MILAIFDVQVTTLPPIKFQANWPFGLVEEANNKFSRWRPLWISDRNEFCYFYLQVTLMLLTKFQVNWPLYSGGEA